MYFLYSLHVNEYLTYISWLSSTVLFLVHSYSNLINAFENFQIFQVSTQSGIDISSDNIFLDIDASVSENEDVV